MKKFACNTFILAVITALTACGGGGSDNGTSQSSLVVPTDAQVVGYVAYSNINEFPITRPTNRAAGTWRWLSTPAQHIFVFVPAPAVGNSTEQDYAAKVQNSITLINTKLSGLLILEALASVPASGNYIKVSYGTSYVPPGSTNYSSYCANVASGVGIGNPIQPNGSNGILSSPVYINIGNGHCDVTQSIVTHEFGHALGLSLHFEGFGNGDAISTAFWDVLATLYSNPPATIAANIVVKRAAN